MKKLIFLLVLSVVSFSNCKYVSDPNVDIRTFTEVIRDLKLENKVYCDDDDVKMIYYLNNNKNINIGLVYKVNTLDDVTDEELGVRVMEFSDDLGNIIEHKKLKNKKYENEVYIRMYLADKKDILMLLRVPVTTKEEQEIYYNSELSDWGFENTDFYPTDDIVY